MELAEKVLNRLGISKPQRKFLVILFTTILVVRGKVNFRNLSRYSDLSEKTYARQFAKGFDFVAFNRQLLNEMIGTQGARVVAFDPSFLAKAGKKTYGRDFFWNGAHQRAEKGLEVSVLSIVDLESNTGVTLSARQTAPTADQSPSSAPKRKPSPRRKKSRRTPEEEEETRIDLYLHHLRAVAPALLPTENHVAVDGYFAKQKWVAGVEELGLHTIGKLRGDANMRFFYTGPKRAWGQGRQKTYAGKVDWQNLQGFDFVGCDEGIELYTHVLNHVSLKRTLRVVVVLDQRDPKHPRYALLFSTDLTLDAQTIYRAYKARFQIEFVFRDAKQFTGLTDCQARDADRLQFHYRAATGEVVELQMDGYPLGVRPDTVYRVVEAQLEPGDRVVFCSDGIIEATDGTDAQFGYERTAQTIGRGCAAGLSATALLERIVAEVKAFTGGAPQGDDRTIVVLRVLAASPPTS